MKQQEKILQLIESSDMIYLQKTTAKAIVIKAYDDNSKRNELLSKISDTYNRKYTVIDFIVFEEVAFVRLKDRRSASDETYYWTVYDIEKSKRFTDQFSANKEMAMLTYLGQKYLETNLANAFVQLNIQTLNIKA
jgi:hypothetical protein